jgi:sulfite dehydrogenase
MNRKLSLCTAVALGAIGLAGSALAQTAGASARHSTVAPTAITVAATEFKVTLSKPSVPVGTTVIFTILNKGKIAHNFSIAGKTTPSIAPGKSAKLTVMFATKGQIAFLCSLPGHAGAGMKGTFAVGVAPVVAKPAATTTKAAATTAAPAAATTAAASAPASDPTALIGDPAAGAAVFAASGCAGCHTLAAAGAKGTAGPNLDGVKPTQGTILATVQAGAVDGGVTMPAFTNLSQTDLNNLVAYVYKSTHS